MFKKPADIVDADIVAETVRPAASQPELNEPVVLETLKPDKTNQAESVVSPNGFSQRAQRAATAAAMNAAINAMNRANQPRPNWAFAQQSSAHLIALGFGSGLMRPAPGTWGTLFGWLTFNYLLSNLTPYTQAITIVIAFIIGIWACDRAGKALGVIDHGAWVWDEVVAFWLILYFLPAPASFTAQIWAFVLFRVFDIVKPPPIREWDARLKNGFGVMWDDIVAAFYTLIMIALWIKLFG